MATSATVQSIMARPMMTRVGHPSRLHLVLPSTCLTRQHGVGSMRVRCMAEERREKQPAPKVSTKFTDVLAFSGPAPERINGRLAMTGFVAALAVELARGDDVLAQLANGGIPWFVGTTVLLSMASLIPLFKGVSVESKSDGVMTSNAELWNGRFAMLGLMALVLTEVAKGGALV